MSEIIQLNPYRDLSKQDPLIKTEMEELEDQLEKEDEERVQRILKSLVKGYKSNKIDGSKFFLEDPGKHWWNTNKMIPVSILNTKFGNLLTSKMKELGFSCYESDEIQNIGEWFTFDYEHVLVWKKD